MKVRFGALAAAARAKLASAIRRVPSIDRAAGRLVLCTYLPFELLAFHLTTGGFEGAAGPEISATILRRLVAAT